MAESCVAENWLGTNAGEKQLGMKQNDVIVVGAGVAGLRCALALEAAGLKVVLFEASEQVGGRIRTETFEGFQLDYGFQVLLTAYDECQAVLDYDALQLSRFEPGAMIWTGTGFEKVVDPWRRPSQLLSSAFNPVGSLADKLRVARLRAQLSRSSVESLYQREDVSTMTQLSEYGFSQKMIETFFRPFYSGIFLEPDLATSRRMFDFVFKQFGQGYAALPAEGMQAIPQQIAAQLNAGTLHLGAEVSSVVASRIMLSGGDEYEAAHVVLATDMNAAADLCLEVTARGWNATQCHYFAVPQNLLPEGLIALNGSGSGVINNVAGISAVAPSYAPEGQSLIAVSVLEEALASEETLRAELEQWFGPAAKSVRYLKHYWIPQALPQQSPGENAWGKAPLRSENGVWLCGDYRYSSSIQGAMASGRQVAEAILAEK